MRPNDYHSITCFTNKRRGEFLIEYRDAVVQYFSNVRHSWRAGTAIENDAARDLRRTLNEGMSEAQKTVLGAGILIDATLMPAPAIGGRPMPFNFFSDMFRLRDFQTTEDPLLDRIDQAIGVYRADLNNARLRTINPLWWIWRGTIGLTSVPFAILNASGFKTEKLENSNAGRLLRFVVFLLTAAASLVAILEFYSGS